MAQVSQVGWNSGQDSPVYKSGLCRPRAPTPRKVEALVKEITFLTRFPTLLLTPRHKERPGTSLWACLCSRQAPPRKIQPWCPALWPLAPPTGVTTASRRCHCRSRPAPRDLSAKHPPGLQGGLSKAEAATWTSQGAGPAGPGRQRAGGRRGTHCSGLETDVLRPSTATLLFGLFTTCGRGGRTWKGHRGKPPKEE